MSPELTWPQVAAALFLAAILGLITWELSGDPSCFWLGWTFGGAGAVALWDTIPLKRTEKK